MALWVKEIRGRYGQHGHYGQNMSSMSIKPMVSSFDEIAANAALVLIGVAISLLGLQLATQAKTFTEEGGFTERLYQVRSKTKQIQQKYKNIYEK